eukprot:TRINITY_DN22654_c0_g1_i1.p1 TRINITY_DN22654_c0_g1~~TRINITY_DN22654_c0_g1_i1.p1  ORF type:complete len:546 (-),score=123.47 TRINITY_DN22654_c0_g1_i1:280-1917(-)
MDPLAKKPKLEPTEENDVSKPARPSCPTELEALKTLVEHKRQEVVHLTKKMEATRIQLEEAKKNLMDAEAQLAKAQNAELPSNSKSSNASASTTVTKVKPERLSPSPGPGDRTASTITTQNKTPLIIPSATPKTGFSMGAEGRKTMPMSSGKSVTASMAHGRSEAALKPKGDAAPSRASSQSESGDSQDRKAPKRKLEKKEHTELVSRIRSTHSPKRINFQTGTLLSSQHKRKLRSLILNPVTESLFATSALDGMVNLWQLHSKGLSSSLLSTSDCLSPKQRRWPEDMTWHPFGDKIFACYSADGGDNQVSIINLNVTKNRVTFSEHKPHVKGILNSISFMPWDASCFATGGSDHAVVLWKEGEKGWNPKALHRSAHSSAVMGVAGMEQKPLILSVGADKRIVGFDVKIQRADFKHQLDSKAMGVLPNPSDFNLYMVQTGTPQKQLRLFDIRARQKELHAFGWKQESSESQSALINQTWSPDGLYIASGTVDPMFHIFDIRYNSSEPAQSVKAHSKRVFKAAWHYSWPLVVSISSDLHIGLHRIS